MWAALGGQAEVAQLLIAAGADVAAATPDDQTAATLAAERKKPHVLQVLRAAGAPADGASAARVLRAAAAAGDLDGARAALAAGAAPDARDSKGRSPLAAAAAAGHVEVVRALLAAGAGP